MHITKAVTMHANRTLPLYLVGLRADPEDRWLSNGHWLIHRDLWPHDAKGRDAAGLKALYSWATFTDKTESDLRLTPPAVDTLTTATERVLVTPLILCRRAVVARVDGSAPRVRVLFSEDDGDLLALDLRYTDALGIETGTSLRRLRRPEAGPRRSRSTHETVLWHPNLLAAVMPHQLAPAELAPLRIDRKAVAPLFPAPPAPAAPEPDQEHDQEPARAGAA